MNKGILRMKALLEHLACIAAVCALLLGLLFYLEHRKEVIAAVDDERHDRCLKEALNPPPPFKHSLDCVGWQRIRSGIPLPAQG